MGSVVSHGALVGQGSERDGSWTESPMRHVRPVLREGVDGRHVVTGRASWGPGRDLDGRVGGCRLEPGPC